MRGYALYKIARPRCGALASFASPGPARPAQKMVGGPRWEGINLLVGLGFHNSAPAGLAETQFVTGMLMRALTPARLSGTSRWLWGLRIVIAAGARAAQPSRERCRGIKGCRCPSTCYTAAFQAAQSGPCHGMG